MAESQKDEIELALIVQEHQLQQVGESIQNISKTIEKARTEISGQSNELESVIDALGISVKEDASSQECETEKHIPDSLNISEEESAMISRRYDAEIASHFLVPRNSWDDYIKDAHAYFYKNDLHHADKNLVDMLPPTQRHDLVKKIREEFTYKNANCDRYDYALASACGLIGGLIDSLFVRAPGEGALTKFSDEMMDNAVMQFAIFYGWKGPKKGKSPIKSAIGYLENYSKTTRKIDPITGKTIKITHKINYDHRHTKDVNGTFSMSTKNHHIKSLGHSPDLVGLFFSILGQFTSTAYFVDKGKLISISSEFELHGSNFVSKIIAGFANWLWHLFSDAAGSSGAQGAGAGIPIPFFSLLQFINVGEFGQYRQAFSTVVVQVFEQGYDLRHGIALSIPVVTTEICTRLAWAVKQNLYHKKPWKECIPSGSIPELSRMLLVAHGSLCIIDASDAAIRSGGQLVAFLLYGNIFAWDRFSMLSFREIKRICYVGDIDNDAVDEYIESEYKRILKNS